MVADRTARRSAELAVASHVAGDAADDGALDASLGLRRREGGECQQAKRLRRVPMHKHLIDQGFLQYVEQRRKIGKPLFYEPARARGGKGANPQWQKVAEQLGDGRPAQSRLASSLARDRARYEDEAGALRLHVWPREQERHRRPIRQAQGPGARKADGSLPRFKAPALNKPRAPHKRVRRTRAQIAADTATRAARRQARANEAWA